MEDPIIPQDQNRNPLTPFIHGPLLGHLMLLSGIEFSFTVTISFTAFFSNILQKFSILFLAHVIEIAFQAPCF